MATILSQLTRDERLFAIEALTAETPKTKGFAEQVKNQSREQELFVTKQLDENAYLASRNLPNVLVWKLNKLIITACCVTKVIITKDAVAQLEEQWAWINNVWLKWFWHLSFLKKATYWLKNATKWRLKFWQCSQTWNQSAVELLFGVQLLL